ncbi:uncharacterized protein UTRI_05297_B [Ustilago trichophora]|uniref:BHLH domain-containing protein n=1 Tax=Ustilago trichophora TaxID=86804 RepID=A0A5C3EK97_9BASI|nr:uncharacterized protein UTRI_05297_B [Ustilago trichophora]
MASIKTESIRGRSPGPAADRRESNLSDLSMEVADSPAAAPARTSKRRKRSELSPSSKATHSIIEKERREAMNEKFSELAANIPELVEAIAAGKRPTKGEIVKASIARHQDQERRVRELMHEVQMLRSGSNGGASQASFPLETPSPLNAVAPEPMIPTAQTLSLPYQIQTSHPIGVPTAQSNLWVGQLLNKTHEPLALCHEAPQPLPLLPDMAQPVSPFKQTSMMNWSLSSLPQPLDPASLSISFPPAGLIKGFMDSGTLEHLSRRSSGAGGPTPTSGFSSPTFTSSDSDSTFSTDALDPSLDDKRFFTADSMSFEPFAMPTTLVDQTPLTSLVGLPATTDLGTAAVVKKQRRAGTGRRGRKDDVKEENVFGVAVNATS